MIEGIKAAGLSCPTRKAFINNLRLVKGYTANGFFDDPETTRLRRRLRPAVHLRVLRPGGNKQFVPQFDGKQFCGKKVITDNKITQGDRRPPRSTPPTTTAAPA